MDIFDKERHTQCLNKYYKEHYGERDDDFWYEQPAVNVWVFSRDGKIITLKSHIITGEVEDFIEDKL